MLLLIKVVHTLHQLFSASLPHTPSAYTDATQKQYTHHSNHRIHIGYHDNLTDRPKTVQEDTACTRLDCCRHLHTLCLHNLCPQRWGPDSGFWESQPSLLPPGWLCSSQKRGTSSLILAQRHTHKQTHYSHLDL